MAAARRIGRAAGSDKQTIAQRMITGGADGVLGAPAVPTDEPVAAGPDVPRTGPLSYRPADPLQDIDLNRYSTGAKPWARVFWARPFRTRAFGARA